MKYSIETPQDLEEYSNETYTIKQNPEEAKGLSITDTTASQQYTQCPNKTIQDNTIPGLDLLSWITIMNNTKLGQQISYRTQYDTNNDLHYVRFSDDVVILYYPVPNNKLGFSLLVRCSNTKEYDLSYISRTADEKTIIIEMKHPQACKTIPPTPPIPDPIPPIPTPISDKNNTNIILQCIIVPSIILIILFSVNIIYLSQWQSIFSTTQNYIPKLQKYGSRCKQSLLRITGYDSNTNQNQTIYENINDNEIDEEIFEVEIGELDAHYRNDQQWSCNDKDTNEWA